MTLVLIGVWAFFWRVEPPKTKDKQVPGIYIYRCMHVCVFVHEHIYFIKKFASCGTLQNPRRPESLGKKLSLPMCGPCVQQILGKRCGIHGLQLLEFSQVPQDTVFWLACKQNVIKRRVRSGALT